MSEKSLSDEVIAELRRIAFADPGNPQADCFGGQVVAVRDKLKALELLGKSCGLFVERRNVEVNTGESAPLVRVVFGGGHGDG